MGFLKQITVLIALAAAGANSLGAQALGAQSLVFQPPVERASGCHEHGRSGPAPRPASFQCCLVGHDTAVPQASPSPTILFEDRAAVVVEFAAKARAEGVSHDAAIDSGGPPEASPLRI